jgi:hypothetical protein
MPKANFGLTVPLYLRSIELIYIPISVYEGYTEEIKDLQSLSILSCLGGITSSIEGKLKENCSFLFIRRGHLCFLLLVTCLLGLGQPGRSVNHSRLIFHLKRWRVLRPVLPAVIQAGG